MKDKVTVHINLNENVRSISCIFNATGETKSVNNDNGKIQLMQNRTYFVPVDLDVDSERAVE